MISFFRKLLGVGAPAEVIGQENEADLRLMMDNSVDVILRVGPDLLQRYVSPSSLQLFGWTPQEMIGVPAEDLVFPEDHHVIAATVARLHAGETDNVTARVRILRKDVLPPVQIRTFLAALHGVAIASPLPRPADCG